MDQKPGIEPRVWAKWIVWLVISWAVIVLVAVTLLGLVRLGQEVLAAPEGPPAYGYDCDSAYRLAEANCPQDER